VRGFCDHPDRYAARLFVALKSDCPCCTFYRGIAVGITLGAAIVAALCFAIK